MPSFPTASEPRWRSLYLDRDTRCSKFQANPFSGLGLIPRLVHAPRKSNRILRLTPEHGYLAVDESYHMLEGQPINVIIRKFWAKPGLN